MVKRVSTALYSTQREEIGQEQINFMIRLNPALIQINFGVS